ncbi:MAG TPA: prepilin peptidase, partial [Bryobacteraceae bacterium]
MVEAQVVYAVLAFLAGLLIGSFLNVCVYRLPRDLSVVHPRSHCPVCEKQIAWYDNIPVVSYGLLGGHCRHCKAAIPLRYLIVELATGASFALCVAILGPTLAALKWSIFSAILITLTATDLEERILPDEFTLGGAVVGIVLAAVVPIEAGIVTFFF